MGHHIYHHHHLHNQEHLSLFFFHILNKKNLIMLKMKKILPKYSFDGSAVGSQAQNINFADTCPSKSKHPTSWFWLSKSKNKSCQYLSKLQKHLPWFFRWLLNWFKSRFSSRITSWPTKKKKNTRIECKKRKNRQIYQLKMLLILQRKTQRGPFFFVLAKTSPKLRKDRFFLDHKLF